MVPQIQPWIDENDAEAVRDAVGSTFVSERQQTIEFERRLAAYTGVKHAVAYTNATCALFAALKAIGVGPGDEVIVPDLTFVATANAAILTGATPVFAEVDPQTMMLSPETVAACITTRTKALVPVHLYGMVCDVEALVPFARRHGLEIVEDAAPAIGARLRGRHAGTLGRAGILSFYGNKTITTGEGGAILTDDSALARAVYRLKNHGRDARGVFVHEEIGFNFSFTEMQAALGISQLDKLPRVLAEKRRIHEHYARRLDGVEGVRVQTPPPGVQPAWWFTNIFCEDVQVIADALRAAEIETRRFLYPMHMQPCYRHLHPPPRPISRRLYETGLSLPSWCGIDAATLDRICDVIAGVCVTA